MRLIFFFRKDIWFRDTQNVHLTNGSHWDLFFVQWSSRNNLYFDDFHRSLRLSDTTLPKQRLDLESTLRGLIFHPTQQTCAAIGQKMGSLFRLPISRRNFPIDYIQQKQPDPLSLTVMSNKICDSLLSFYVNRSMNIFTNQLSQSLRQFKRKKA